ncbi:MAG TPA: DUF998 domain-containing protein [Chryseolinea sp.]
MKKQLLICGMVSSLFYIAMNAFIPFLFDGYSVRSHTVSELSAIGAPTRQLWVTLAFVYMLLFAAFGFGVLKSAAGNRSLKTMGIFILIYCAWNFYWPPMHPRGGEPSLTDTLHIVWASVTVILMMLMMGFGAAAFRGKFRVYTIGTMILLMVFGFITSLDATKIPDNLPTPLLGIWERILIALFMFWVIVLSIKLLRSPDPLTETDKLSVDMSRR